MKILVSIMLSLLAACQGGEKKEAEAGGTAVMQQIKEEAFPFPDIPPMLTEPEQRKEFLLKHYWDNFNFADTALVNNRNITEQGFVNQVALLADGETSPQLTEASIGGLCSKMERNGHSRRVFMDMIENYLYNPNSPFYNEWLYMVYLRRMIGSEALGDAEKSTLRFRMKLVSRNCPGNKAEDFTYYLPGGEKRTLYATAAKNNRMLLAFYDPECPTCHETLLRMANDARLADAVAEGRLTVVAIYTEGNEKAWRESLPEMPEDWIVGTDRQAIQDGALYDLKAMPTLYLLDGGKRVILKDKPYGDIFLR